MLGKKGFTLIELLVVMAIISVLTAMVLVNVGKNDDQDIRLEAERLKVFLRDAQNKALTAEKVSIASGKVCGFGVNNPGSGNELWLYYIETTNALGNALDVDCSSEDNKYSSSNSHKLETFSFKNGVTAGAFEDLFFLSPHGEVYAGGVVDPTKFPFKITLSKGTLSLDNIAQVDQSGRIY